MWLLVILSIVCITVAAERFYYQIKKSNPLSKLQKILQDFFANNDVVACQKGLQELDGIEAKTLSAGLEAYDRGGVHSAEQAIAGVLIFEKSKLDKGLIVIGTTGSNAPLLVFSEPYWELLRHLMIWLPILLRVPKVLWLGFRRLW